MSISPPTPNLLTVPMFYLMQQNHTFMKLDGQIEHWGVHLPNPKATFVPALTAPPAALQLLPLWSPPGTRQQCGQCPRGCLTSAQLSMALLGTYWCLISMTWSETSPTSSSHHPSGILTLTVPHGFQKMSQSCSPPACAPCPPKMSYTICQIPVWGSVQELPSLKPPSLHPVWGPSLSLVVSKFNYHGI